MFGTVARGQSNSPDAASPAVPSEALTVYEAMIPHESVTTLVYSNFVSHVDGGDVHEVMIAGSTVTGKLTDGTSFRTIVSDEHDMIDSLLKHRVRVAVAAVNGSSESN
ncbi:hypothetical protein [Paraburkholderia hospita]|uniref:hypothetical protein n=1 Tax=Paraburkholderia hospita TaxID=169430 RepID=UPI001054AB27|nr:hypothetical protein [Paraburkholderia hospita]